MRNTSGRLQDINAFIQIVKQGKRSKFHHVLNRLILPYWFGKSDNDWLKVLYFERKQEIRKIKFYEKSKEHRIFPRRAIPI